MSVSSLADRTSASGARSVSRGVSQFGMRCALTAVAGVLLLALPAGAAEIEDVEFAETVDAEGRTLELASLGLLRYPLIVKAYVAGLYVPPGQPAQAALEDRPKRLEIRRNDRRGSPDRTL